MVGNCGGCRVSCQTCWGHVLAETFLTQGLLVDHNLVRQVPQGFAMLSLTVTKSTEVLAR